MQTEYIDELVLNEQEKPENEVQLIDQMEIPVETKPENEVQTIEEFIISGKEKEPLVIEYLDYLTIEVDQNWLIGRKIYKIDF